MTMDAGANREISINSSNSDDVSKKKQNQSPEVDITIRARSKAFQETLQSPRVDHAGSVNAPAGEAVLEDMWSATRDKTPPKVNTDELSHSMGESPEQSIKSLGTKAAVGKELGEALQSTKSSADPKIQVLIPKVWERSDSTFNSESKKIQNARVCKSGIAIGCERVTLAEVMNEFSTALWHNDKVKLDENSKTASGVEFMTVASAVEKAEMYEIPKLISTGVGSVRVITNLDKNSPDYGTKAFYLTNLLGKGSFGTVNQAEAISRVGGKLNQTAMAYKRAINDPKAQKDIKAPDEMLVEAKNLKRILLGSNPEGTPITAVRGLPSVHEVFSADGETGLLMRLAKDTMPENVKAYVDNEVKDINPDEQDRYKKALIIKGVTELAMGLDYMHQHGNIHGDIKLENTYIFPEQWTLADFGDASTVTDVEKRRKAFNEAVTRIGNGKPLHEFSNEELGKLPPSPIISTPFYVPFGIEELGRMESDVFALGIAIAEIAIGAYLGNDDAYVAGIDYPSDAEIVAIWNKIQTYMGNYGYSREFLTIIANCIQPDKEKRYKTQQLVKELEKLQS